MECRAILLGKGGSARASAWVAVDDPIFTLSSSDFGL